MALNLYERLKNAEFEMNEEIENRKSEFQLSLRRELTDKYGRAPSLLDLSIKTSPIDIGSVKREICTLYNTNALYSEIVNGKTTVQRALKELSSSLNRGLRRFSPRVYSEKEIKDYEELKDLIGDIPSLEPQSPFKADNFISGMAYSFLATIALSGATSLITDNSFVNYLSQQVNLGIAQAPYWIIGFGVGTIIGLTAQFTHREKEIPENDAEDLQRILEKMNVVKSREEIEE